MTKTCPTQESPYPLDHEGRMIRLAGRGRTDQCPVGADGNED